MDENGDNVIRPKIGARLVSTDTYRKIRFPSITGLQIRSVERRYNKNKLLLLLLLLFYYYSYNIIVLFFFLSYKLSSLSINKYNNNNNSNVILAFFYLVIYCDVLIKSDIII